MNVPPCSSPPRWTPGLWAGARSSCCRWPGGSLSPRDTGPRSPSRWHTSCRDSSAACTPGSCPFARSWGLWMDRCHPHYCHWLHYLPRLSVRVGWNPSSPQPPTQAVVPGGSGARDRAMGRTRAEAGAGVSSSSSAMSLVRVVWPQGAQSGHHRPLQQSDTERLMTCGALPSPGTLRLLVVWPDDDPLNADTEPVLALAPVTAEPDLGRNEEHHTSVCSLNVFFLTWTLLPSTTTPLWSQETQWRAVRINRSW